MEISSELSDLGVVMQSKHTMLCIFHKNSATGRPIGKTLIKYIAIAWRKTMEKRRNKLILSLLIKKQMLIMMKMLLALDDQI